MTKQVSGRPTRKRETRKARSKSRSRPEGKRNRSEGKKNRPTRPGQQNKLHTIEELPLWAIDNRYILSGYRAVGQDVTFYLRSIFAIHNETVNIWSHMLGFLLFACFCVDHFMVKGASTYSLGDNLVFAAFYFGSLSMFLLSTLLHTFGVVGEDSLPFLARFDYIGISLMITGSFFPVLFYIYYCDPVIYSVHLGIIVALGLGTLHYIFAPGFHSPQMRTRRTIMFCLFGFYAIFPLGQFLMRPDAVKKFSPAAIWIVKSGCLYLGGAAIFVTAMPERLHPGGWFDLLLSSHQIWHCCVLGAAVLHWYGCWEAYDASQQGGWRECTGGRG